MRGHSGRRLFRARCNDVTRELMGADGGGTNDDAVADEAPPPAQVSAPVHDDAAASAWHLALYRRAAGYCQRHLLPRHFPGFCGARSIGQLCAKASPCRLQAGAADAPAPALAMVARLVAAWWFHHHRVLHLGRVFLHPGIAP